MDDETSTLLKGTQDNQRSSTRLALWGSGIVSVLFVGAVVQTNTSTQRLRADTSSLTSLPSVQFTTFSATNFEIQNYGPAGGDYPWMDGLLVEPYSETTFYGDDLGNWEVAAPQLGDDDTTTRATGVSSFAYTFRDVGEYTLTFENTASSTTETTTVYVKYVRREIRSLDDGKLRKFKKAFAEVMRIRDEVTGQALYGKSFTPFSKLAAQHANWAGAEDCDHLHDGMGFVTTHVQMSRILEVSLQAVDPSVSLPYWEYTKDVEHIIADHNGDFTHWKNLEIFSTQYFGATDDNTAQIEEGVFSDFTVEADLKYSTVLNSYGLMRAPWNNNGNLKLTRYFGGGSESTTKLAGEESMVPAASLMSSCSNLYTFLEESETMEAFTYSAEGLVHGPIHLLTGGIAGTPELLKFAKNTLGLVTEYPGYNKLWNDLGTFFIVVSRAIFRNKLLACPEAGSCEVGVTSSSDCACTCDTDEVIKKMRGSTFTTYGFVDTFSDAQLQALVDYYCVGGVVFGDQATASAAADPSFYSLHGTVERYLQLSRLANKFTSEDWPSREDSLFVTNAHPYSKYCAGHYEDDMLLFGTIDGRKFTNVEYYSYLDPRKNEVPYVYDHFDFEHCTDVGIDIKSAVRS